MAGVNHLVKMRSMDDDDKSNVVELAEEDVVVEGEVEG